MRGALLVWVGLAGCAESGFLVEGGFDTGRPDPLAADLCLEAEPAILFLEAAPAESAMGEVILSWRQAGCEVDATRITGVELDDPTGAFGAGDASSVLVNRDNDAVIAVSAESDAPGRYEAQVEVLGVTDLGEGALAIELVLDVIEPGG